MKCPICNGKGYVYNALGSFNEDCGHCQGTGKVRVEGEPMTNEEWIKSLDTEGLVDYLYEVHKGGNSVERQRWIERHREQVKMQFRGWLKEIHDDNT